MICEKCGAEFDDELQFCPNCSETSEEAEEIIVPEEAEIPEVSEEAVETEEYSADELELVEEDEEEGEEGEEGEEDFEVALYDGNKKLPLAFKIIAIIVAAALVVLAAGALFYGVIRPDIDSPVASWFDDGVDKDPIIYTKKVDNTYGLYVGETQLVDFGSELEQYKVYTDFIFSEDNVYYIVNDVLYWYNIGSKAPVKVADAADKSSLVICANGNRILFTATADGQTTLYSYIKGKKAKEVAVLTSPLNSFDMPNYGFIGTSSEFWYINAESQLANGELYATSFFSGPKLKYQEIGSVVYYSSEYDAIVYTLNAGPEVKLYTTVGKNEPVLMAEDFIGTRSPAIIKAPVEGVAYVAQGNGISNTLFFQPFDGSEAKTIDTGVTVAASVWDSTHPAQPYYDYGAMIKKTDALFYMKGFDILISRGANPGQKPIDFTFYSTTPTFSDDSDTVAYLAEDKNLMVASFDGTAWPSAKKIADNVAYYQLSADGKYVSYLLSAASGLTANLYNVETGETQQLASNAASEVIFVPASPKTVIFASDYNMETQKMKFNYYTDGGAVTQMDPELSGLAVLSDGTILVSKPNAADANLIDLYTLDSNLNLVPVASALISINSY